MKTYRIKAGTPAKLLTCEPYQDIKVEDWVVRQNVEVTPIIDPLMYQANPSGYNSESVGVKLALQGYGVYCAGTNANPHSKHFIAVLMDKVDVLKK